MRLYPKQLAGSFAVSPELITSKPSQHRVADRQDQAANSLHAAGVGPALLAYLRRRLGMGRLHYQEALRECDGGWEAYTYRFRLRDSGQLPRELAGPLAVRLYGSPEGLPRARHEFAVQRHLCRRSYPVVEPLLLEEDCSYLGGPFLIMPLAPGRPLLAEMVKRPWKIFRSPGQVAALHARLHMLSADGFPSPGGPFLERRLDDMARLVAAYDLAGLRPGLAWLAANRPELPPVPSILHLDFHPLNLICVQHRSLLVLDWTEADVGDPHADVATSLMLMACIPVPASTLYDRSLIGVGRFLFRRWYLRAYRWRIRLDGKKLAYYRAWAAFGRLCRYGAWLHAGPQVTGSKPSSIRHLTPGHVGTLEAYFQRRTGVRVSLERAGRGERAVAAPVPS